MITIQRSRDKFRSEIKIIIIIFVITFLARAVLAYLTVSRGYVPYYYWFETFNDFFETSKVLSSLSSGILPYLNFLYQYPPLSLYVAYPFFLIGGKFGFAFLVIIADSCSAVLIYKIVREFASKGVSTVAWIAYALSPFVLLYEGLTLMNIEPMLFFILLAVYFLHNKKLIYSSLALSVAIMFRQEALFALLMYLPVIHSYDRKTILKAVIAFLGVIIVVSGPFLILAPYQYISMISYNTRDFFAAITPNITELLLFAIAAFTFLILYKERKSKNIIELWGAFGFALLIMFFVYFDINPPFRYYYLPVYALLLAGCTKWKMSLAWFCFTTVSLIIPPGYVQEALPYLTLLTLIAIQREIHFRNFVLRVKSKVLNL